MLAACYGYIVRRVEHAAVRLRTVPTTNPIARLLSRNPFGSIQEHMRAVIACADEVPRLFEAVHADDAEQIRVVATLIDEKEAEADRIKNELRLHLPRTMFLPVNRRDLLDVLDMQDSIADVAQDIADLVVQRSMRTPEPLRADLVPFVGSCVDACHAALRIVEELDELLETGFRGREATAVDEMITGLNEIEDLTDAQGGALANRLFHLEDSLPPVSVMFWYRLLDLIGDLADYAEKVGNRLRLLIAQ